MSPSEQRPNLEPPPDFYLYVLREPLAEKYLNNDFVYFTVDPTDDIQAMVERAMEYKDCEILREVNQILGGWQAVIKSPHDEKIIFLWQDGSGKPGL